MIATNPTSTPAGPSQPIDDAGWSVHPLAQPRRAGWVGRFSTGHLVMVVAGLLAVVCSVAVLREHPSGVLVSVADGDIRAGDAVDAGRFRTERVEASGEILDSLLRASNVGSVRGWVATTRIADGELIARASLRRRAAPDGLRAMSIPIETALAVGGRLTPGDRIDVLFAGASSASIIIGDAQVLDVDERSRGGIGESSSPFTVTIAVTADQSQVLAAAIADGDVSIARTTGARSSAGLAPLPLERATGGRG